MPSGFCWCFALAKVDSRMDWSKINADCLTEIRPSGGCWAGRGLWFGPDHPSPDRPYWPTVRLHGGEIKLKQSRQSIHLKRLAERCSLIDELASVPGEEAAYETWPGLPPAQQAGART